MRDASFAMVQVFIRCRWQLCSNIFKFRIASRSQTCRFADVALFNHDVGA
jgi:hypothetical protein